MRFSPRPHLTISLMLSLSLPKMTILGPVAMGSIKAKEQAKVAGIMKSKRLSSLATAMPANKGRNKVAVAVLLLTSVKNSIKITILITIKATSYGNQIVPFKNLESSTAGKDYINTSLPIRLIGQLFTFLIIPLWIAAFRIFSLASFELIHMISAVVDLILAGLIIWLLSTSYSFRRK